MPEQLFLPFDASDVTPQAIEQPGQTVGELATRLRLRVLALLREADRPVGIHELRRRLGHSVLDTDPDPQENPVNRLLQAMRDAGEIVCHEPPWGEPSFSLPAARHDAAASRRPRRQAQHSVELFEVGDAVEFDIAGADRFGELVAVDDALNNATVHLFPSHEQMTVSQDLLRRVTPDPLSDRDKSQ